MIAMSPEERLRAGKWCPHPARSVPPPGAVRLDLKARCPCGRFVGVTKGGKFVRHRPPIRAIPKETP